MRQLLVPLVGLALCALACGQTASDCSHEIDGHKYDFTSINNTDPSSG